MLKSVMETVKNDKKRLMYQKGDILRQQFELQEQLGVGGFSEVWKAIDLDARDEVAIKIFLKQDSEGIDLCREEFRRMNYLRHPNILRPRFFSHNDSAPFFVMPYCALGSTMDKAGQFTEQDIVKLIAQVGSALNHIHSLSHPILHNDIKPDNILEESRGFFVLADFGLSDRLSKKLSQSVSDLHRTELLNSEKKAGVTPMAYRAPELFNFSDRGRQSPTRETDIWAFGATLYQLASDSLPFDNEGGLRQQSYRKTNASLLIDDMVPQLPGNFSRALDILIKKCLSFNPTERPTAEMLVRQAEFYISNGYWELNNTQNTPASSPPPEDVKSPPPPHSSGRLIISPEIVDFGKQRVGELKTSVINLVSKGIKSRVHITVTPPFMISMLGQPLVRSLDLTVTGDTDIDFEVHYEPDDTEYTSGLVYVSTGDIPQETVELRGQGLPKNRPFPILLAAVLILLVGLSGYFIYQSLHLAQAEIVEQKTGHINAPKTKQNPFEEKKIVTAADGIGETKQNTEAGSVSIELTPQEAPGVVGEPVEFRYNSKLRSKIRKALWDFGDGEKVSSTQSKITHIYRASGNYTVKLCVNDTICVNKTIRVNQVVVPKPVCNPEFECSAYGVAGIVSGDISTQETELVSSATITLKPRKNMSLKSAAVYSDNSGSLLITIRDNADTDCGVDFSKNVAQGRCQIFFSEDYTLLAGHTYKLSIQTKSGNVSPNAPKLKNFASQNPGNNSGKDLTVDYQGKAILLDIKYCH